MTRSAAALAAVPSGNGHTASVDIDYPSPTGTPEQPLTGSGFSFGRLTPQDAGSDDHRPGPALPLRLAPLADDGEGDDRGASAAETSELGLPVRVRQANLAPQLRDVPPEEAGFVSGGFSLPARRPAVAEPVAEHPDDVDGSQPTAAPTSPEAARDMVSALQRGWLLGRAEARFGSGEETEERPPDGADEAGHHDDD
jgi:hypothetical protein